MAMRVLIVDDDEDARILLERALAKGGLALEVVSAVDGRDALERSAAAPPHAVITDVMMPRMNGLALCAALRAASATARVPVIMVTALEDEDDRAAGLAAGADAYLTKPFSWSELTERLETLLHARYGAEAALLLRPDPA
jgi:DNA-binding response OmpR family regulator